MWCEFAQARSDCKELNELVSAGEGIRQWFVPSKEFDLDAVVADLYKLKRPFFIEKQHYLKSFQLYAYDVEVFAKRTAAGQYSLCVSRVMQQRFLYLKQEGDLLMVHEDGKESEPANKGVRDVLKRLFDDLVVSNIMRYLPLAVRVEGGSAVLWETFEREEIAAALVKSVFVRSDVPLCLSGVQSYVLCDDTLKVRGKKLLCRVIGRKEVDAFVCYVDPQKLVKRGGARAVGRGDACALMFDIDSEEEEEDWGESEEEDWGESEEEEEELGEEEED